MHQFQFHLPSLRRGNDAEYFKGVPEKNQVQMFNKVIMHHCAQNSFDEKHTLVPNLLWCKKKCCLNSRGDILALAFPWHAQVVVSIFRVTYFKHFT